MTDPKKPSRAAAVAVAAFCALCVFLLGLSVAANHTLIDESAVAAWDSFVHGSFGFAITFALIVIGGGALGAIVVVFGWLLKTVTDAAHNYNDGLLKSYKGQRDTAFVLLAISGLALVLTHGMNLYNGTNVRSGFIESAMMGQVNNLPKSVNRVLLADLRAGKWYRTTTDSAIVAFFKESYREINWSDRAKIEAFLGSSLSRPWDISKERPIRVTMDMHNNHIRYTFRSYRARASSALRPSNS